MILAFGDSLTNGCGVENEFSYPSQLEKKTGLSVMNAGIDGEFSQEGLVRLPTLLNDNLDMVILCHGGNDVVNRNSHAELKSNLLQMIKIIQKNKIEVLFVAVPDYFHSGFGMCDIYDEIAQETGVMYECDVLRHIDLDRSLKSDHIHPNEKGYEKMADALVPFLVIN